MKKKNTAKKAVLPALLAVLCSTAALTSVSYAWFTMGREASVNQIDVNVQAADGIQVSVDAANWKSIIDAEDLRKQSTNQMLMDDPNTDGVNEAKSILPVSTIGTVTNGVQEMFLGEVQKDSSVRAKEDTANYIQFDLYVKLDSDQKLSLAEGSYVKDSAAAKNTHLASRVSFANLGVEAEPTDALALGTGVATTSVIWEPNADLHTTEAKQLNPSLEAVLNNEAVSYEGVSGLTGEADSSGLKAITTQKVTTIQTPYSETGTATANELLDLKAGINKVRVYIWLEGQDVDCHNDISDGGFGVGLNFSVPEVQNA